MESKRFFFFVPQMSSSFSGGASQVNLFVFYESVHVGSTIHTGKSIVPNEGLLESQITKKISCHPKISRGKTHRFSNSFPPHAALVMNMAVSEKGGTSKSSILIGFSNINHPFWGTTIFGNTHIGISFRMEPLRSDPIRIRGAPNVWKFFFFQTPPGPVSVAGNVGVYRVLYL